MSQYLVTEFSRTRPQILVISDDQGICDAITPILDDHGFTADCYTYRQLSKATTRDRVRQQSYYKVLCFFNLASSHGSVAELQTLLSSRREPIMFVTRFDSTVDVDNIQTRLWYQACRDQYRTVLALAEGFPRANILIVRDLLLADNSYHPAFPYIFRQINSGLITDPGIDFFFVSQDSFLAQIEPQLFLPYSGERLLFVGSNISSTAVFRRLNDATDDRYKIVIETYPPVDFSFPFPVTTIAGQSDLSTLTHDYLEPYFSLPRPQQRRSSADKLYASSASASSALRTAKKSKTKSANVQLEEITLPPPKAKIPTPAPASDFFTLPPDHQEKQAKSSPKKKTAVVSSSASSSPSSSSPSSSTSKLSAAAKSAKKTSASRAKSKNILKAVRKTITSEESTVLERYLEAEKKSSKPVCRRVDMDGFNFYQCAPVDKPTLVIPTTEVKIPKIKPVSASTSKTDVILPEISSTLIFPDTSALSSLASESKKASPVSKSSVKTPVKTSPKSSPKRNSLDLVSSYFPQSPTSPSREKIVIPPETSVPVVTHKSTTTPQKDKKYSKTHIKTYKKAKSQRNIFDKLFGTPAPIPLQTPGAKKFYRRYLTNQIIAGSAVFLALVVVFSYFLIIQPRLNEESVSEALTTYFLECEDVDTCFSPRAFRHTSTFSLVKNNDLPDLVASISRLATRREKLTEHLDTYFATTWQAQSGDVASELKILSQSLDAAQNELATTRRLFANSKLALHELAGEDRLEAFAASLDELDSDYTLLAKYLPFLESAASQETLPLTVLFLDDNIARTGGGLFLGAANFQFLHGAYQQSDFVSTTQLADSSPVQINTPHQLEDLDTTEVSGFHNLTFHREFSDVASLLTGDLASSLAFQPQLVVSINLSTLADFEHLLAGTPINNSLHALASTRTTAENEAALLATFTELDLKLDRLSPSRGHEFVYTLLHHLDDESFQFYTTSDTLKNAISDAGLRSEASSVRCPSGFGSSVCYLDTFSAHEDYLAANAHLAQQVKHVINLDSTTTRHTRTITYTNQSPTQTASDYLTFTLPLGAELESLTLDGRDLELDEDDAYTLTLSPSQTAEIEIVYTLDRQITSSDFTYAFYDQHQNGLTGRDVQVVYHSGVPYSISIIAPNAVTSGDTVTFTPVSGRSFFGAIDY